MVAKDKIFISLQSDSSASDQFFNKYRRKSKLEGEKKLMFAVLEDAVLCFRCGSSRRKKTKKRDVREVERWIFEENSDGPFAFETICEALALNPKWIRERLLREKSKYRKKGAAGAAKRPPKD